MPRCSEGHFQGSRLPDRSLSREKVFLKRMPGLDGAEVLSAYNCNRPWKVYHETYAVCTVVGETRTSWKYRGRNYDVRKGQVMLVEPGEIHRSSEAIGNGDFRVLFLSSSVLNIMTGDVRPLHWKTAGTRSSLIFNAFAHFYRLFDQGRGILEQHSRLAKCLELLAENCGESSRGEIRNIGSKRISLARDYIRENWQKNLTLQELANVSGLSQFHFLRSFGQAFGLPPHAYQLRLKIERARVLLAKGMPPDQLELGFADQSHLIRHFKRAIGVTPGRYAQLCRRSFSGANTLLGKPE